MSMQEAETESSDHLTRERGKRLKALLKAQRWSGRSAAMTLGLSHTYVAQRLAGSVELRFSDVELFAGLLEVPAVTLYEMLLEPNGTTPVYIGCPDIAQIEDYRTRENATLEHAHLAPVTQLGHTA